MTINEKIKDMGLKDNNRKSAKTGNFDNHIANIFLLSKS